jgi:hypothetical protein
MSAAGLTLRRLMAFVVDVALLVTRLQIGVAASTYALTLVYLVVVLRNGGSRSLPDLVAGTTVARVAPAAG